MVRGTATRQSLGKRVISTHDDQNELENLNDTELDEVAAAKKALTLEIKAQDDKLINLLKLNSPFSVRKQPISTHDEKNELETLNDLSSTN